MSPSSKTKSELEDEVEELRNKLYEAHLILSEALGHDIIDLDDLDDEDDEDDDD